MANGTWTWDELKQYWIGAEQWLENEASHVAVLWARAMHAERAAENEASAAVETVVTDTSTTTTDTTTATPDPATAEPSTPSN